MIEHKSWIPVALSTALEPGTSAGTLVGGGELVVWRDTRGAAHVWEDRCPHRGMRMSFGFVRGDHIACLYHGWQYDTAGQCQYIPAHPTLDVPKTIKVPTYTAAEKGGIIWAAPSSEAAEAAIPVEDGEVVPVRSIYIDRPFAAVLAALTNANIPAFTGDTAPRFETIADGIVIVSTGADRLLIACQPFNPTRTALHLVIQGSAETYGGAGQKHFARWAETFRLLLETASTPVAEVA
ncbi:oxidoreductase [Metarhizobium album]|uniref:Oxidoreductase n=1 Tax=Metarhizobium album TaxID=2182425 RepID=A0A2U2DVX7_9HYPH|nr:Rieske (2Fe-2S) protein [Rhizobium album]PWE57456.1 oxidoreductase [Rhizobium album]